MNKTSKTVRASDIGACAYCPYQVYLRKQRGDSQSVKRQFNVGNEAHERFNARYRTEGLLWPLVMLVALIVVWFYWRSVA